MTVGDVNIDGICAVVVIYRPPVEAADNVRAMTRECGATIVADNGSEPGFTEMLREIPGVEVLSMGGNVGLAAAFNRGLERARERGARRALLFDQDSRPRPGLAAALVELADARPRTGVVGARIADGGEGAGAHRVEVGHPWLPCGFRRLDTTRDREGVFCVISSGSLIDLKLWSELGGFDAGLFIDYIDVEYCLRVARSGRTVAVAASAILDHKLGDRSRAVLLGHDFRPMNHAPFRHYYMARNRVRVWRRHAAAMPGWAAFDLCFAIYNLMRVLCFERAKAEKLREFARGTWHGLAGGEGERPA